MEKRARGRPRGGGSKLNRTETVTIRLDPRLRYLAEIAARVQRRTVSSFIEWVIEKALEHVMLNEGTSSQIDLDFASALLWDPMRLIALPSWHSITRNYSRMMNRSCGNASMNVKLCGALTSIIEGS